MSSGVSALNEDGGSNMTRSGSIEVIGPFFIVSKKRGNTMQFICIFTIKIKKGHNLKMHDYVFLTVNSSGSGRH